MLRLFFLFVMFITMLGAGGYWLLTTTSGLQWLLSTTSQLSAGRISFTGVGGTFSTIRAEAINFVDDEQQFTIQDFKFDWQPYALFSGKLLVNQLAAEDVEGLVVSSSEPSSLPESLQLPISLSIQKLDIASLRLFDEKSDTPNFVANNLSLQLESDGQIHHLSDLQLHSEFGSLQVSAQIAGEQPFAISAQAKLSTNDLPVTSITTLITGNLAQLDVKVAATNETLKGRGAVQLQPFADFPVTSMQLAITGLNPNTFSSSAPTADLTLQTKLKENSKGQLAGKLMVKNDAAGSFDNNQLPIRAINTDLKLTADFIQLEQLLLRLTDDGSISGNLSWQHELAAGVADLTVSKLNPLALDARLQAANINGKIQLDGDTVVQQGSIALNDESLSLDAIFIHKNEVVTLKKLQLKRNQSVLTGTGALSLAEQQTYYFDGEIEKFNLADFLQAPPSNLNAHLKIAGKLTPDISGSAQFKFNKSQLDSQPVTGNVAVKFNTFKQAKGIIALQIGENSIHAKGGFGKPNDQLQLDIVAPDLSQIGMGLAGSFNLQTNLSGSVNAPEIHFDMTGNNLKLPGDHAITSLVAQGGLHNKMIALNITLDDYQIENETKLQQLNIVIDGQPSEHKFTANAQIDDAIQIKLAATGGLTALEPINLDSTWSGQLSQLSVTGPFPLDLIAATKLKLSKEQVSLATTELTLGGGQAKIKETQWTPQKWHSQGKFTGISLRPDSDDTENQPELQLGGEWNVTSADNLTGFLNIAREQGDWVLTGETPLPLGLQTLQLAAKASQGNLSAELKVVGERVGVTNARIKLPLSHSDGSWGISPNAAMDGQLDIKIDDIAWIGQALGENIKSDGQFDLQAKIAGTLEQPELQGEIHGDNLALELLEHGIQLQQGKLEAKFDQELLQLNQLNFVSPDAPAPDDPLLDKLKLKQTSGKLAISGTIGLAGNDSQLEIKLDHLPLAHESNHWIIVSGETNASFSDNTLSINGKITADAGFISQPPAGRPQLSEDIVITGQAVPDSPALLVNLDATLDLGKQFYLRASGLEGRLAGRLHLESDKHQNLNVTGSIATHDTSFEAYGQLLKVERGLVYFNGPLDDPGLNVLAIREEVPVQAGVEVLGTVRHPRVRLVSTPNMPDPEKLSWLVFGRSLESGGVDASMLIAAAGSILGGQSGGITRQLRQALGVDELSIRQKGDSSSSAVRTDQTLINQTASTLTGGQLGSNTLSGQIGTVGKRISSRAYISYERGLATSNAGVTKLTYTLTPRIKVVTQAGIDSAADIFYTFQFD